MRKQEVLRFIEKMQRNTPSELSAPTDMEMFKIRARLEVLQELHKAVEDWGLRFVKEELPMQKEAEVLYSSIKGSSAYEGETIEELRQKLIDMEGGGSPSPSLSKGSRSPRDKSQAPQRERWGLK